MIGKKVPSSKLFYQFSLDGRVPADHLLRRVTEAVDFSFVYRMTKRFYSHTGQPSVDPVVLFKMALIGFLYGIVSERRLAEEIDLHEIVQQCERAGLIRGDRMFVDSPLVEANASKESEVVRAAVVQVPDAEEHVKRLWEDNPETEGEELGASEGTDANGQRKLVVLRPTGSVVSAGASPESEPTLGASACGEAAVAVGEATADPVAGGREAASSPSAVVQPSIATEEAGEEEREVGAEAAKPPLHVAGPGDPPNKVTMPLNEVLVNRVDPDAEFVQRKGVLGKPYYKVDVSVDRGWERIITAVEVTGGGVADEHLLERMIKEHEGNVGRPVQEVGADAKYGTIDNYKRLEELGKKASTRPGRLRSVRCRPPTLCTMPRAIASSVRRGSVWGIAATRHSTQEGLD